MNSKALLISPEAPYPVAGGGPLRTASLLEYLSQRYDVDLILFHNPDAPSPAAALPPGKVQRVEELRLARHSRRPASRAVRNLDRLARDIPPLVDRFSGFERQIARFVDGASYELAVVEHFWCAPYWRQIAPRSRHTVLNLHNIESDWHERCAQASRGPQSFAHAQFAKAARKLERHLLEQYSMLLATSPEDAERLLGIAPGAHAAVYPNTVPFVPLPCVPEQHSIAFSGTFDYEPNQGAVRYFREHIWPRLRQDWPDLSWTLVGKNPGAIARDIAGDPRICCTGMVEDAIQHLAASKVAIAPLLAGSGTRLKILEAWAAGRPVVSTTFGSEGLPVRDGTNILLADTPSGFAAAVSRLLASPSLRQQIGRAGRELYEAEFTWTAAWRSLDRHLSLLH